MTRFFELGRRVIAVVTTGWRRETKAPSKATNTTSPAVLLQQLAAALRAEEVPDEDAGEAEELLRLIAAGVSLTELFLGTHGPMATFHKAAASAQRLGNKLEAQERLIGYRPVSSPLPPTAMSQGPQSQAPEFDADGELLGRNDS